jgi:hypothetical protein
MNEENSKKLKEYLSLIRRKVGLDDFVNETCDDDFKDVPKPQFWSDINALTFDPDRWLIPDLIPREGVSMWASVSGEGKSFQMLHLAKSLSVGSNLYGNPNFPTKKSKVLYINLEMSVSEMQRRGRMIGFDADDKNLIILNEDNFNLNGAGLQDFKYRWLLDFILKEKIEVLIIDTFRPTIGAMREDKSEDVRAFFQKFLILKNVGISVIFTEHLRKPTHLEGRIPKKEQVLGSQDKVSNLEVLIMLRKDEAGETLIYQRKNRLGPEIKPFAVKLVDRVNEKGEKIMGFNYIGEIEDDATKKEEAKGLILDILSSGESRTTNQLLELAKKEVGQKNVRRALNELKNQGEINMFKTGKQNTYSIPREESENTPEILSHTEQDNIFDSF